MRCGSPTVLLTIEMERADLDQSVEAREAGAIGAPGGGGEEGSSVGEQVGDGGRLR